jgi:hypothetical protein
MKKILFVISPGVGMMDNLLNLTVKIKSTSDFQLIALFLNIKVFLNTFEIYPHKYFNEIILKLDKDNFYLVNFLKFKYFVNILNKSLFFSFLQIMYLFTKLNLFLKLREKYFFYRLKNIIKREFNIIDKIKFFNKIKLVIYDCTEERKEYFNEITKLIEIKKKISIYHGSLFPELLKKTVNLKKKSEKYNIYNLNIICFSKKKSERDYYESFLNINNIKFYKYGNPKHSLRHKKISFCQNKKNVILISRHADPKYFPIKQKIYFLKIIRKIILEKLNLNLIVKLHPKENEYISINLYKKTLGSDYFKKKWNFTKGNPMIEKNNCLFGITFYSGISVDWSSLGFPSIELNNLRNIDKKILPDFCYYHKNKILFGTTLNRFSMNARNENELLKISKELIQKNYLYQTKFKKNYNSLCPNQSQNINKIKSLIDRSLLSKRPTKF